MAEVLISPQKSLPLVGLQRRFGLHTRGSGKPELQITKGHQSPFQHNGQWKMVEVFFFFFFHCNSVMEQVLVTQLHANG